MADDDYLWDPRNAPDPEIARLEALLQPVAHVPAPLRASTIAPRTAGRRTARWPAVAAATLLAAAGLYAVRRPMAIPWSVEAAEGVPTVWSATGTPSGRTLEKGGVMETDATTRARLTVGRIGRAELGPGSRLRLIGTGASQHLLSLERGTMHASVDAPPRYFLVQTASALAVDLGCDYVLRVNERGDGLLTVEEGEVELLSGQRRVAVLAGNAAALHAGSGPGLPYPVGADTALRDAVAAYDAEPSSAAAFDRLLAATDASSTITLWHLLQRATPAQRERVFAHLSVIAPPPATVTRERVVRGESGALQRWRTDLQRTWAVEPSLWRKLWNPLDR